MLPGVMTDSTGVWFTAEDTAGEVFQLKLLGGVAFGVNTVAASGTAQTIPTGSGINFITLTGNCTFTFPTATAGAFFEVHLKQDATGSRLATWPGTVKWPGGTAPTLTITAAKTDSLKFRCLDGTNWYGEVIAQNL